MNENDLVVNGFLFSTKKDYSLAKDELDAIAYIQKNTDLSKPNTMLKLYRKLVSSNTFQTPIGYMFLNQLQEEILKTNIISYEELEKIKILPNVKKENEFEKNSVERLKQKVE